MDGIATQCGMVGTGVTYSTPVSSRDFIATNDDYINIGDDNAFSFVDGGGDLPFSIAFWGKIYSGGRLDVSKYSNAGTPFVGEWNCVAIQGGAFLLQIVDGGTTIRCRQDGATSLLADQWYHFVATYDGTASDAGISLYIDGSAESSTAKGEDGSYVKMENSTSPLLIGSLLRDWDSGPRSTDAKMADVRLYSKELSSGEVSDLYNGTDVRDQIVGRWIGDDDIVGTTVPDLSGNGYDGTNFGSDFSTDGPGD